MIDMGSGKSLSHLHYMNHLWLLSKFLEEKDEHSSYFLGFLLRYSGFCC